jgi:hypothetical protein
MRVSVRGSILPATLLAAMTALLAAQPFDEARFAALMRAVVRIDRATNWAPESCFLRKAIRLSF